ncbi:alpha/beta hydrolase family protein [Aestuariispira insulae]|uniref:Putative dienelactone hydrolase n=1 Tax=Aestuariispira insulae TaxID=1461337 RepID=A0A3D9H6I1_9PROT|nr:hypothetical protein [Aestuariispira insulae]RED45108.1 putative dienelactone hydrolase [Aestuariispira insulae]
MRMRTLPIASVGLFCLTISSALSDPTIGYRELQIPAEHREQLIRASLWYPTSSNGREALVGDNAVFSGGPVQRDAEMAQGRFPLVLMSHGSGGSAENMNWLASALVRDGGMVLAVNHPGSTTGNADPKRAVRHWTRPKDLSAALDYILADRELSGRIDRDDISGLGFSLGGASIFSLGGGRMDLARYLDYCRTNRNRAEDCLHFVRGGVDLATLPQAEFEQELADRRIKRLIGIDPGLIFGMAEDSIRSIKLPSLVINLGTGTNRLFAANSGPDGNRLSELVPDMRYHVVPAANHFSFLALCKHEGARILREEGEDPICDEPPGGNRAEVHRKILRLIRNFLSPQPAG